MCPLWTSELLRTSSWNPAQVASVQASKSSQMLQRAVSPGILVISSNSSVPMLTSTQEPLPDTPRGVMWYKRKWELRFPAGMHPYLAVFIMFAPKAKFIHLTIPPAPLPCPPLLYRQPIQLTLLPVFPHCWFIFHFVLPISIFVCSNNCFPLVHFFKAKPPMQSSSPSKPSPHGWPQMVSDNEQQLSSIHITCVNPWRWLGKSGAAASRHFPCIIKHWRLFSVSIITESSALLVCSGQESWQLGGSGNVCLDYQCGQTHGAFSNRMLPVTWINLRQIKTYEDKS